MNAIHLTGRLTRDPDLRALPDGSSVCKMRLAVDRMGRSNATGYIDVASFGKPAAAAEGTSAARKPALPCRAVAVLPVILVTTMPSVGVVAEMTGSRLW